MCDCERASRRSEKTSWLAAAATAARLSRRKPDNREGGLGALLWQDGGWGRDPLMLRQRVRKIKNKPNELNVGVDLNGTKLHEREMREIEE